MTMEQDLIAPFWVDADPERVNALYKAIQAAHAKGRYSTGELAYALAVTMAAILVALDEDDAASNEVLSDFVALTKETMQEIKPVQ